MHTLHSSLSSQLLLSGFLACPSGHTQVKEPTLLRHVPPWHRPGMASHSSISARVYSAKLFRIFTSKVKLKLIITLDDLPLSIVWYNIKYK